jgi:hypothetical protein
LSGYALSGGAEAYRLRHEAAVVAVQKALDAAQTAALDAHDRANCRHREGLAAPRGGPFAGARCRSPRSRARSPPAAGARSRTDRPSSRQGAERALSQRTRRTGRIGERRQYVPQALGCSGPALGRRDLPHRRDARVSCGAAGHRVAGNAGRCASEGDEFAWIMSETDAAIAERATERARRMVWSRLRRSGAPDGVHRHLRYPLG